MFGRGRRLATQHTIDAIRPILGAYPNVHGLPPGFWQDDFVIGFIGFLIGFHVDVTSGQKLSTTDKGYLLADVFTALSNINGVEIRSRYTQLAFQQPKNPDFELGADYALICAAAALGKVAPMGERHLREAEEVATKLGKSGDVPTITSHLLMMLFFQEVEKRFYQD